MLVQTSASQYSPLAPRPTTDSCPSPQRGLNHWVFHMGKSLISKSKGICCSHLLLQRKLEVTHAPYTATYMLNDRAFWEGLRVVLNGLIPGVGTEHIAKAGFHLSVQEVVVRVFEVQVLAARQRQRMANQQFLRTLCLYPMSSYNNPPPPSSIASFCNTQM